MDQGLREIERRLELDPFDPEPLIQLSRLYERRGALIQGRAITEWTGLLIGLGNDQGFEEAFDALTGAHPFSALAIPELIAGLGRSRRWPRVLAFIKERRRWSLPYLVTAFASEDYLARSRAIEGIGALGPLGAIAMETVARGLEDEHAWVRQKTVEAIANIGPRAAALAPQIRVFLSSGDRELAFKAAITLENLDPDFDFESARQAALSSSSPKVRQLAREYGALPPAWQSLRILDPDSGALEELGEAGIPILGRLIYDPSSVTRSAALRRLVQLSPGHPRAIEAIADAIHYWEDRVKHAARAAFEELGPGALESLKRLRDGPRGQYREEFSQAVDRIEGGLSRPE